ncbi:hypothetical protein F2Q69_00055727 [Brassica cretica]|uniref:Uncharacterized protein n=1 Tax=Brassica cretica TaxID=69181 RepID=A0A8S9MZD5_BRACR|nr:hypothetical protein F2Q69_00055727 [Brassica cretica]
MLKQILESQNRSEKHVGYELKNLHTKVDGSYNDLNNKFSNSASNFKALENQFASMSCNSKRPMGSLPGTSEQNPKETMKSITLRSGKQLSPRALIRNNEKQGGEVVINVDDDVVIVDEKTNEEILEKIVEVKGKAKVGEEKNYIWRRLAAAIFSPRNQVAVVLHSSRLPYCAKHAYETDLKDLSTLGRGHQNIAKAACGRGHEFVASWPRLASAYEASLR